jgi:hypothetical protein
LTGLPIPPNGIGVETWIDHSWWLEDPRRGWIGLARGIAGGHVLVDHELVQHVGLVVEVEAAIGRAGDQPHQIPQQWLLPR